MNFEECANAEAGLPTESLHDWEEALLEEYQETLNNSNNQDNAVKLLCILHVSTEKS